MKKLKVITVVGTRPELIRLSLVIKKLDLYCEHVLVHTGQNFDYELNEVFFKDLSIRRPDFFLDAAGSSAAETIGLVITRIDEVFSTVRPQALLVLGDTNSCLAVIPAKRRKIPIFHMEAGNRCYDFRVPEEINRKIVDHTSDVNLVYSDIAREALLREGLSPDLIIKTGSPMYEVLNFFRDKIEESDVLERLSLKRENFFLCSLHREENVDSEERLKSYVSIINYLNEYYNLPVIFSTHPRTRKQLEKYDLSFRAGVISMKPLGFFDYVNLQTAAKVVLSDSGTISEESSILNFPALNLRESQERHEALEEAIVPLVGSNIERVFQSIKFLEDQGRLENRSLNLVEDYRKPNVSDKVVRIIHSHTDYVNRVIWRRYDN